MNLKYFGTDGIRGKAFVSPITIDDMNRWGQAWSEVAKLNNIKELVIGWDPRLSSDILVDTFISGLDENLQISILGLVSTPIVSYVVSKKTESWGVMFSASHNPPKDNGIKGLNSNGEKLSSIDELCIERYFQKQQFKIKNNNTYKNFLVDDDSINQYLNHIGRITVPNNISLVLDCSYGTTALFVPLLFSGKNIHLTGTPINGTKINLDTGSTNINNLQSNIKKTNSLIGIAFDGDGDRCILINRYGYPIDGDQILWLLIQFYSQNNKLIPGIIGTIMSNGGLEESVQELNIPFLRTNVGDKHISTKLIKYCWQLAAESSGHVIQKHINKTGDGLAAAIIIIKYLSTNNLSFTPWIFKAWHMNLLNITTKKYLPIRSCSQFCNTLQQIKTKHKKTMRVVIRWSGTETKLRLMIESKDKTIVNNTINKLKKSILNDLNN